MKNQSSSPRQTLKKNLSGVILITLFNLANLYWLGYIVKIEFPSDLHRIIFYVFTTLISGGFLALIIYVVAKTKIPK